MSVATDMRRAGGLLPYLWALYLKYSRYRIIVRIYQVWTEQLTLTGRTVLIAAGATVIAGMFQRFMVGSYAFSTFAALFAIGEVFAVLTPTKLKATRDAPTRSIAGGKTPIHITVTNEGKHEITDVAGYEFRLPKPLELESQIQYAASILPGESHTFTYMLKTPKRGAYVLPGPVALSAAPLGLMHRSRHHRDPAKIIVYPSFHPLVNFNLPAGLKYQPGGLPLTSKIGNSLEFIGTREYQTGDRLQDLHSRSWARVGYPVVRQFQEEFLTRVAILVDTHLPDPPPRSFQLMPKLNEQPLESLLSLAAAVADHLARKDYIVDLFAAGPDLYHLQAGRSLAYLDNILDILACIERCPEDPFDVIAPIFQEELNQISTVIVLLLNWDEARADFIHGLGEMGVQVRSIVVTDDPEESLIAKRAGATVLKPEDVDRGVEKL